MNMGNQRSNHFRADDSGLDESVLSPESGYDDGSRIDELIEEGRSLIAEAEQRITANRNRIASLERAVDEYVSQSDENLQEIRRNVEELHRKIADFDGRLTSNERRVGGIAQLIPSLARMLDRVGGNNPPQPAAQNNEGGNIPNEFHVAGQPQVNGGFQAGMGPRSPRVFIGPRGICPRCNKKLSASSISRHSRLARCPGTGRGPEPGIRIERVWSQSPRHDPHI